MALSDIAKKWTLDKKKKKKSSIFSRAASFLSNKLMKPAYKSGTKFVNSNEWKALVHTIKNPKEVIRASWNNVKKVGNKLVNNKLQNSGHKTLINSFKSEAGNVMKPVWNLIKSGGDLFTWVADTTDKVQELWKKVKEGKLSTWDAITEAATTVWLQWVWALAAPFIIPVWWALKQLWVEKDIEKLSGSGQKWLEDKSIELFSNWTEKSKNKIKSRVQSAINLIQAGTMVKWMKNLWKANKANKLSTKIKETVKWWATMWAVPITLTVLWAVAWEEWKKLPNADKMWAILGQTATSLAIPTKMKWAKLSNKVKWSQLSLNVEGNKPKTTKPVDITQLMRKNQDKILENKPEYTEKQKKQIISHNKWVNKRIKNTWIELNELQTSKREGKTKELFGNSKKQLEVKKDLIKDWKKDWLLKDWWTDKWLDSTLITEKGRTTWLKWKWLHTPKENNKKVKETEPLAELVKEEVKPLSKKIKEIPKLKKWESVDIFAKNKKGEIEPAVVKDTPTGNIDKLDIINDIKKWDVVLKKTAELWSKNDLVRKTTSTMVNNLGWVLKNINIKTKEGLQNLGRVIDWIKWESKTTLNKTLDVLWYNDYLKIENKNTKGINSGYEFVKKNIDKLIPWNDLKSRIIKYIALKDDNSIFNRTPSKKWVNTTKARVILNAIYGKTKLDIKNLEEIKRQEIDKLDISDTQKKEMKADIEISPEEQTKILNKNIELLPKDAQKFVREVDKNFGLVKEDSKLKEWFRELWEDLEAEWVMFKKWKDYMHWYVNRDTIKAFRKELKKEWIDVKDFDDITLWELMWETLSTPEQMTKFLKKKKNAWALHSNNPLDIMMSYANDYTKLIERKTINKLLDKVASVNKEAGEYLKKELHDGNSFLYKKLLDMHEEPSLAWKAGKWLAKWLSVWTYIGNTKMIPQNVAFAWAVWWMKYLTNLLTWKWKIAGKASDLKWARQYLFEEGLLSHKDFNIDKKFTWDKKWNVSLSKKVVLNTKDSPNKLMRIFTASLVPQIQSIIGQSYMAWIVKKNGWIKWKETIVDAYKRILDSKPTSERIKIRWELAESIKAIEDATYSNTATHKALDIPLFNMIKSFSRQNLQAIKEDITNITELANSKKYWKFNKELKTKAWVSAADLASRTYLLYGLLYWIAQLIPWTDDEKEKFVNYTFAESMWDYLTNLLSSPVWMPWVNILSNDTLNALSALYKMWNTDDTELRKKYLWDLLGSFFTWIKWLVDTTKNMYATYWNGDHTIHESWKGWFAYKNTDSSNPLYAFMWINPTSSAYSNMYNKIEEYKSDLPRTFLDKWEDFSRSNRVLRNYTNSANKLRNAWKYARVETALKKMKSNEDKQYTKDEWIEDILKWASDEVKKAAYDSYNKAIKDSWKELNKLLNIWFDIAWVKDMKYSKWDFNKTLKALAIANPRAYEDFMQVVLWYYTYPNWAPSKEMKNKNADFISNLVSQYTNSTKMSTTVASQISDTLKKVMQYKYTNQWKDRNIQDELNELTKIVEVIKESPELYEQVKESIAELARYNFNKKDRELLNETIKWNPLLKDLYEQWIKNRWWVLENEEEKDILNEEQISNNKEDLWNNKKETAIWKKWLAELVKMKYQKLIDEKQMKSKNEKNDDLHLKALEILMKK